VELAGLDVEEEDLVLPLDELSLLVLSVFASDLDSAGFAPLVVLASPFWPLRA
jgi:hypothetical protein